MDDSNGHHLTLGQLLTTLASISLLPAVFSTVRLAPKARTSLDRRKQEGAIRLTDLFEDEDGVVTEQSQREYAVGYQKATVLLAAAVGTGCSYAASLRSLMHDEYSFIFGWWVYTATWTLMLLHALYLQIERGYLQTYSCACHLLVASSILFTARGAEFLLSFPDLQVAFNSADWWIWSAQLVASFVLASAAACVPRRPGVEHAGRKVDDMNAASVYSYIMFAWMSDLFAKGWRTGHLDESDLKLLPLQHRSKYLYDQFRALKQRSKIWWTIFNAHRWQFVLQYVYQTVICITQFLPHFAMLQILKALEQSGKKGAAAGRTNAWVWVVGMFLAMMVNATVTNALYWLSFGKMNLYIRNELASLIFNKTMRKKDVKGGQKADKKDGEADDAASEHSNPKKDDEDKKKEESEEDSLKGLRQGVVNLIAVDAYRVSNFGCWSFIFYEAGLSIAIGFGFLLQILGWQSILAGLALYIFLTPLNQYLAGIYLEASDKVMKVRDKKLAVVSEALQGIRQIKFAALEDQWQKRIEDVRKDEMTQIWRTVVANTWLMGCWIFGPIFLAAICLGTYAVLYGSLSPAIAFTALAVFQELEFAMSIVPELIGDMMDAKVSAERIQKHLDSPEKEDYIKDSTKIVFKDATIAWASDADEKEEDRFAIRDINVDFPVGELSLITGATGSGKSLMLAALLGEADLLAGSLEMPRPLPKALRYDSKANADSWILSTSTAYVSQIPWIENATIKDNIIFGLPIDEKRYNEVIRVCSLKKDMEMMEDGDMTAIGEQGINLSGGQKWRISLARAVYSRAGILIFDDIFSAVDAHVGNEIFKNCLTGEIMKGRTRILVTHHLQLCLPKTDYIVDLKDGRVERAASVSELKRTGSLTKLIEQEEEAQKQGKEATEELAIEDIAEASSSNTNGNTNGTANGNGTVAKKDVKKPREFTKKEFREKGAVKFSVYRKYTGASGGIPFWSICIGFFVISQALNLGRQWWMKLWTGSQAAEASMHLYGTSFRHHVSSQFVTVMTEEKSLTYWLGLYILICFFTGLFATLKYFVVALGSYRASINLFNNMTHTVLRAPTRWFDTTPVGRILNRFSADFTKIDSNLANHIAFFGYSTLSLIGIVIAAAFITPLMLVCAVLLFAVALALALFYLKTAREIKRIESVNKSPIFELFGSVLLGVGTIRAFGEGEVYIEKMDKRIDTYAEATFFNNLANRWMGIRMTYLGAVFSTLVGGLVVSLPDMDAALAGFAMSFAMEYTFAMIWALRRYADLELDFNAAERVLEYTVIDTEDQSGATPPAAWPHEGKVEVKDLVVAYAEDLEPVLKGISFDVKPRERVGVVGRTGAGKSSLTLAIFRFLRAREGSIVIDGIDISKITLKDLRSRLAIIPQDPVLFSGTIRSNLDPFDEHTDEECRAALTSVNLVSPATSGTVTPNLSGTSTPTNGNTNVFASLDSKVSESGLNLSQGQRQLLCLARVILTGASILVMDEATSSIDHETDAKIQEAMRETNYTVITIAHRLNTIMDYDRVLVLEGGKVVEFEAPKRLLEDKGGRFRAMCEQTGMVDEFVRIAGEAWEKKHGSGSS